MKNSLKSLYTGKSCCRKKMSWPHHGDQSRHVVVACVEADFRFLPFVCSDFAKSGGPKQEKAFLYCGVYARAQITFWCGSFVIKFQHVSNIKEPMQSLNSKLVNSRCRCLHHCFVGPTVKGVFLICWLSFERRFQQSSQMPNKPFGTEWQWLSITCFFCTGVSRWDNMTCTYLKVYHYKLQLWQSHSPR